VFSDSFLRLTNQNPEAFGAFCSGFEIPGGAGEDARRGERQRGNLPFILFGFCYNDAKLSALQYEGTIMKRAFTLIELLIVVAIIGILAAIAVPNFMNAQIRASIARVESDFKTMNTAIEMYRLDKGGDIPRWGPLGWAQAWARFTTPVAYMSLVPIDVFESKFKENFAHAHNWYEYNGCRGTTAMKNLKEGQIIDNYVLVSYGPDGIDDTINISDYPNAARFMQYDASNGLRSSGDILKETKPGLGVQQWR
jgi:prepilin-type N-terminal cleavage/methylation domain-containing protein